MSEDRWTPEIQAAVARYIGADVTEDEKYWYFGVGDRWPKDTADSDVNVFARWDRNDGRMIEALRHWRAFDPGSRYWGINSSSVDDHLHIAKLIYNGGIITEVDATPASAIFWALSEAEHRERAKPNPANNAFPPAKLHKESKP